MRKYLNKVILFLLSAWSFAGNSELSQRLPTAPVVPVDLVSLIKGEKVDAFIPLKLGLELKPGRIGALDSRHMIHTPVFGGRVDLASYIKRGQGSFFIQVSLSDLRGEIPEINKVYFVSHTKKFDSEERPNGLGCDKFFDVTTFVATKMMDAALEVFVNDLRHLTLLGGTFLFVAKVDGGEALGALHIVDSRFPERQCLLL